MAISYLATGITASSDTATPFANLSYTLPASTQTGDPCRTRPTNLLCPAR